MKKFSFILIFILSICLKTAGSSDPVVFSTTKPWVYWWWPGSAVTEKGITHNMEAFAKAGFGGLHIIPIYGAKGFESSFQNYLGAGWQQKFAFVLKEANRLHLGIDMTLGTGWPLGGPQITKNEAAKAYKIDEIVLGPNQSWQAPTGDIQAVSVYVDGQFTQELISQKKTQFQAGNSGAKLYQLSQNLTNQKVKRAAPGRRSRDRPFFQNGI
jgi:hypothetical protein